MKSTILNYAVIQSGQCVFGVGSTPLAAYRDASKWLERDEEGNKFTPSRVAAECRKFQFDGDLKLIYRDDNQEEFDSYMRDQGGFIQTTRGNWHAQ